MKPLYTFLKNMSGVATYFTVYLDSMNTLHLIRLLITRAYFTLLLSTLVLVCTLDTFINYFINHSILIHNL